MIVYDLRVNPVNFSTLQCMQIYGHENKATYESLTRRKNALACNECERNKSLWTTENGAKCSALWLMAWPLGWFCCAFGVFAVPCVSSMKISESILLQVHIFLSLFLCSTQFCVSRSDTGKIACCAWRQVFRTWFKRRCRSFQFSISIALSCSHWFRRLATLMLIAHVCAYACGSSRMCAVALGCNKTKQKLARYLQTWQITQSFRSKSMFCAVVLCALCSAKRCIRFVGNLNLNFINHVL